MTAPSPDAPEPSALDFETWWIKHIRSDASGMVGRGLASIIWQAASAAQAKRIAVFTENHKAAWSSLARLREHVEQIALGVTAIAQRLAELEQQRCMSDRAIHAYYHSLKDDLRSPDISQAIADALARVGDNQG